LEIPIDKCRALSQKQSQIDKFKSKSSLPAGAGSCSRGVSHFALRIKIEMRLETDTFLGFGCIGRIVVGFGVIFPD
jgi:hypothetical protein